MKKLTALFLLMLATAGLTAQSAQEADHALLSWNPYYKLQWYDFRGKPPAGSRGDAGTSVLIKAKPFMVKNNIYYEVTATFNRKKSWVRDTSSALLRHEQLHFDIAELYARKVRQRIQQLRSASVKDVKTYNAAVRDLLAESDSIDSQYDLETLHGALSGKQASWSQQVREGLEKLERYEKPRRIIVN